jgi:hypothetical protein
MKDRRVVGSSAASHITLLCNNLAGQRLAIGISFQVDIAVWHPMRAE